MRTKSIVNYCAFPLIGLAIVVGFAFSSAEALAADSSFAGALATAVAEGKLTSGQLRSLKKIITQNGKIEDLVLSEVSYGEKYVIGKATYKDKLYQVIAFSNGTDKSSFIAVKPDDLITFGVLFPKLKKGNLLEKLNLFHQLELYTSANGTTLKSQTLPDAVSSYLDVFYASSDYTVELKKGANLFAKIDLSKSGDGVSNMVGFFGLKEEKALQVRGSYTGLLSPKTVHPFIDMVGMFPAATVQIGPDKKSEITSQMAFHISMGGGLSPNLSTAVQVNAAIGIGVSGITKIKIGQQTLDVSLEAALTAEAKTVSAKDANLYRKVSDIGGKVNLARMAGFRATMKLANDKPWQKAFGIPWLTIEDYLVTYGMQGPIVYGGLAGKTTFGDTTLDVAALTSSAGIPEQVRLILDPGPQKVGAISTRELATIFNVMSKAATGKDGISKAIVAKIPEKVRVAGHAVGEGPILDINTNDMTIEVKGVLFYMDKEIADVRQGTVTEEGVLIDADVADIALGPVTISDASFQTKIDKDTQFVKITGAKKGPLGGTRSVTASFSHNRLQFKTDFDGQGLLDADYTLTAQIPASAKAIDTLTFGIQGNVTSDLSQWLADIGSAKLQEQMDELKLDQAILALEVAKEKVASLQTLIDQRKASVEQGQENNDQALQDAIARVGELDTTIDFLDDRIDEFQDKMNDCNDFKALRKTTCKSARRVEITWAQTRRQSVIAAKKAAQGVVQAIQDGLELVPAELDPYLASLYTAKETADLSLKAAEAAVNGLDNLTDFSVAIINKVADINTISIKEGHIGGYIGKGDEEFGNPFELDLKLRMFKQEVEAHLAYSPKQKEMLVKQATYFATGTAILAVSKPGFPSMLIPEKAMSKLEDKFLELSGELMGAWQDARDRNDGASGVPDNQFDENVLNQISHRNNILKNQTADQISEIKEQVAEDQEEARQYFVNKLKSMQTIKDGMVVLLKSGKSNRCVDTTASTSNNAEVQAYDCNGQFLRQRFLVNEMVEEEGVIGFQLISEKSQKCLTVPNPKQKDGTNVVQSSCASGVSGHRNQIWFELPVANGMVSLKALHNSKCLDLEGGGTTNGTKFQQWSCVSGEVNQAFLVQVAPPLSGIGADFALNAVVSLVSKTSGKCIDNAQNTSNGAPIKTGQCSSNFLSQQFTVSQIVDGDWLQFKNKKGGKCLSLPDPANQDGTDIIQKSCASGAGDVRKRQLWKIIDRSNGWVSLQSRKSDKCLDLEGGGNSAGTPIQQWQCVPAGSNQMFKVQ